MKKINKLSLVTLLMVIALVPSTTIAETFETEVANSTVVKKNDSSNTENSRDLEQQKNGSDNTVETSSSEMKENNSTANDPSSTIESSTENTSVTEETFNTENSLKQDKDTDSENEPTFKLDEDMAMGSSFKKRRVARSLSRYAYGDLISITEANRPPKNFVDVSSWNGYLTVTDFQTMKKHGVTGVVVKLTQSNNYISETASTQIRNAQAAGLKVSAYHFSVFANQSEAIREANYFADAAISMGLSRDTIMVNDAEYGPMNNGQLTNNSIAFANQLKTRGYTNVLHYSQASWFTENILSPSRLGVGNIWVASYPYEPLANQMWYQADGYAAWQWSSLLTIPGVYTPNGSFDINADYTGRFTNGNSGPVYDTILDQKAYNYSAKIKPANESIKHSIYNDVNNTGPGATKVCNASVYADQKVTVVGYAKTSSGIESVKIMMNGKALGWIDKRGLNATLDTAVIQNENRAGVVLSTSISSKHALYSKPANTAEDVIKLGLSSSYADQEVKLIQSAKLSNGMTMYQFQINGQTIGWANSQAFKLYDAILDQKAYNYSAKIKPANESIKHSIYNDVNNTGPGATKVCNASVYADQKVTVVGYAKTSSGIESVKIMMNGKALGWIDKRGLNATLDTAVIQNENRAGVVLSTSISSKHALYSKPANTAEDVIKLGLSSSYADQEVKLIQSAKLSNGMTMYQFQINGQTIGWANSQAFKLYDAILDQKAYNYSAKIKPANESIKHSIYNDVNNTGPGATKVSNASVYADQKVTVVGYAKTSSGIESVKIMLNGKTLGWIDKRGLNATLDTATLKKENKMATMNIANESKKHALYSKPANTAEDVVKLGLGSKYANQQVKVIQSAKLSNGITMYQFQINNKTIGWINRDAFK
ncbi:GW domain-containing glycosaminoglycan-binding protein [Enterococcus sp. AZ112]|uniref:GW domain-containing glycosaminoglycan-binding protein n=1 Tax=Enterococcus sp. AZ112 TaxID=2774812 RepID=UPI003F203C8A